MFSVMAGHGRSKNGVASLARSRFCKNGVASLARSRFCKNGVASLAYDHLA